jgi:uncharacterized membrane protein YgdD (TMEM256/DUF423 family)
MERLFLAAAAISGFVAVAAGAFGAHVLKKTLPPDLLDIFEKGVRYEMYHALGLGLVAWAATRFSGAAVAWAGWLFIAGTVIFSGSLYALALTGIRGIGAVTVFGGLAFLGGWIALALAALKG